MQAENIYNPEIEVIPLNKVEERTEEKQQGAWKLHALTAITLISLILFNFCAPIRQAFFQLGTFIQALGWPGPFLLMLINGLIVIPLALPYPVFEMTIALLVENYFAAVWFSLAAKTIGAIVSYVVTKNMRERIRGYLSSIKVFKGIEYSMEKDPVKFSLIIRIMILPIFVKNYGLAIPKSVNFKLYMVCELITNIPITIAYIYILRQAGNMHSLFDPNQSWQQMTFSLTMLTLSIALFVYIAIVTREVLKQLEVMQAEDAKAMAKDMEIGDEAEDDKQVDSPIKEIELKETKTSEDSNQGMK